MSERMRTPQRVRISFLREQQYDDTLDLIEVETMDALITAAERAHDLADLAAHVVCEPRRFLNNEDNVQHLLGEAVARVRDTLTHFEFDHESNEPAASDEGSTTGSSTEVGGVPNE